MTTDTLMKALEEIKYEPISMFLPNMYRGESTVAVDDTRTRNSKLCNTEILRSIFLQLTGMKGIDESYDLRANCNGADPSVFSGALLSILGVTPSFRQSSYCEPFKHEFNEKFYEQLSLRAKLFGFNVHYITDDVLDGYLNQHIGSDIRHNTLVWLNTLDGKHYLIAIPGFMLYADAYVLSEVFRNVGRSVSEDLASQFYTSCNYFKFNVFVENGPWPLGSVDEATVLSSSEDGMFLVEKFKTDLIKIAKKLKEIA